jgi:hypothetical protein
MGIVLKVLAIVVGIGVVFTLALVWRFWRLGGFGPLMATGAFGLITVLGWVLTLAVGPVATVQLWRIRESGRLTSLFLAAYGVLYYAAGWVFFRQPATETSRVWLGAVGNALLVAVLVSGRARRACHSVHLASRRRE